MPMTTEERDRQAAREAVDDAVHRMLEAGFGENEVRDEFEYVLSVASEDGA